MRNNFRKCYPLRSLFNERNSMKILFLDSPAFAKKDMLEAFHNCNIETDLFMHEDYNVRKSAAYDAAFDATVENTSYDFVFSFNYYPILATCAHRHNLRYVSYVYDSPLVALYSFTITYPTNYIFLFDYPIYEELKQGGIDRVFYLPLAANAKRLSTMQAADSILDKISSEISFVGSLYNFMTAYIRSFLPLRRDTSMQLLPPSSRYMVNS